jgi:hypothetical protein
VLRHADIRDQGIYRLLLDIGQRLGTRPGYLYRSPCGGEMNA